MACLLFLTAVTHKRSYFIKWHWFIGISVEEVLNFMVSFDGQILQQREYVALEEVELSNFLSFLSLHSSTNSSLTDLHANSVIKTDIA